MSTAPAVLSHHGVVGRLVSKAGPAHKRHAPSASLKLAQAPPQLNHGFQAGGSWSKEFSSRTAVPTTCYALSTSPPRPLGEGYSPEQSNLQQLPRSVENLADDPSLHNPLQRMNRLGTGWIGIIMELEGVAVEYSAEAELRSWESLAQEEGKPKPFHWALTRAIGMKAEQAISEVFVWTRNPVELRRLAVRKEQIYKELTSERKSCLGGGIDKFLSTVTAHDVPVALVSSAPEARTKAELDSVDLAGSFAAIVSAEDVYRSRPDPEPYVYAAQLLQRPPPRCVVVGTSNHSIEAAHECGMKCVAVASRSPVYELKAADLVVRSLDEVSFVNLKQLFRYEDLVGSKFGEGEEELEMEEEVSNVSPRTSVMTMDVW